MNNNKNTKKIAKKGLQVEKVMKKVKNVETINKTNKVLKKKKVVQKKINTTKKPYLNTVFGSKKICDDTTNSDCLEDNNLFYQKCEDGYRTEAGILTRGSLCIPNKKSDPKKVTHLKDVYVNKNDCENTVNDNCVGGLYDLWFPKCPSGYSTNKTSLVPKGLICTPTEYYNVDASFPNGSKLKYRDLSTETIEGKISPKKSSKAELLKTKSKNKTGKQDKQNKKSVKSVKSKKNSVLEKSAFGRSLMKTIDKINSIEKKPYLNINPFAFGKKLKKGRKLFYETLDECERNESLGCSGVKNNDKTIYIKKCKDGFEFRNATTIPKDHICFKKPIGKNGHNTYINTLYYDKKECVKKSGTRCFQDKKFKGIYYPECKTGYRGNIKPDKIMKGFICNPLEYNL